MARPTKYNPKAVARIVEAIELGATYALAAGYAGVSYKVMNEWRKAKPEFAEAMELAEGRMAVRKLRQIQAAAEDGNWTAAAWTLERRFPQEYGRTIQEHAGELKTTVEFVNDWRTPHPAQGADDADDR